MSDLTELIEKWENSALELREAESLISLLIEANKQLERWELKHIKERDCWEDKATELANDIGAALGFDVGEHSNVNCPVQEAIDGLHSMRTQIDEWRNSQPQSDGRLEMNVIWNSPDVNPSVDEGDEKCFWVAIDSKHSGKVHVFLAMYQNRPLGEPDEDGEYHDDALMSPDGEFISSVGWVNTEQHNDFVNCYVPIMFDDNYKLVGWAEYQPPTYP